MRKLRQLLVLTAGGCLCLISCGMFADSQDHDPTGAQPIAFVQDQVGEGNSLRLDSATKDCIEAGLAYLARHQHVNGSFGTSMQHGSVAITSLAGLAFMAGGHQPGRGQYGKEVTRALEYVIRQDDGRGFLQYPRAEQHRPMYAHGFATLFLAEAQGMVHQPKLRDELRSTLKRAVNLIISSQNSEGGWRYLPAANDADLSVTICQIMALRAARNAGLTVPKSVVDNCIKYVKACQDPATGGFNYQRHLSPAGFARTAAGVVALNSAGKYLENRDADGEAVRRGLEFLKSHRPGNQRGNFQETEERVHYFYGHYYAAQAMWIAGGNHWKTWFPAIRSDLVSRTGFRQSDGSWTDRRFCPHYCTAMALIILQIPNNYLPIMQR